jgi:hypothetical protein
MSLYRALLFIVVCACHIGQSGAQPRGVVRDGFIVPPWYYFPAPLFAEPQRPARPIEAAPPQVPPTYGPLPIAQPSYWFCTDPRGYYPDVTRCAGGWQQVVPRTNPPPPPIEQMPLGGTRLRSDTSLSMHDLSVF